MQLIDADKLQDYFWDNRSKLFQAKDCRIAIDNAPTAEAIPKADYEARLKADMVAMLEDLDLQIDEFDSGCGWDGYIKKIDIHELIQQKINALKAESEKK